MNATGNLNPCEGVPAAKWVVRELDAQPIDARATAPARAAASTLGSKLVCSAPKKASAKAAKKRRSASDDDEVDDGDGDDVEGHDTALHERSSPTMGKGHAGKMAAPVRSPSKKEELETVHKKRRSKKAKGSSKLAKPKGKHGGKHAPRKEGGGKNHEKRKSAAATPLPE